MWGKPLSYPKAKLPNADLQETRVRPRFQSEKQSSRTLRFLIVFVVCVIVVLALIAGLLRLPDLQISEVRVEGARSLDPLMVQNAAWKLLEGNYASVIPKTNVLFLSKDRIEAGLTKAIPSISQVSFEFKDRKVIVISIHERAPSFVWCSEHEEGDCYFVDKNGILFEEAPTFTPGVFVVLGGGKEIPGVIHGSTPFTKTELSFIEQVIDVFGQKGLSPLSLQVATEGDVTVRCESYPNIPQVAAFDVRFTEKTSPEIIRTTLSLLDRDKNFVSTLESNPNDLQYVDLRFPNKIIYKFKQGGDATVAPQVP